MENTKLKISDIVKKKLWKFGYSVKDYTEDDFVDFDLLVDGNKKVIVGDEKPKAMPKNCDVFATVEDGQVTFITKPTGKLLEHTSPYGAFGKK